MHCSAPAQLDQLRELPAGTLYTAVGLEELIMQWFDVEDIEGLELSVEEVDAQLEAFLKLWRKEMEKSDLLDEETIDKLLEGTKEEALKELRRLRKVERKGEDGGAGE